MCSFDLSLSLSPTTTTHNICFSVFFCHICPQFSHVTTQIYTSPISPVPSYLHAVPRHQPQHAALQLPPAAVLRSAGAGPWRQRGRGAVEEEPGFKWTFSHWKLQFSHWKLQFSHWKLQFSHCKLQFSHWKLQILPLKIANFAIENWDLGWFNHWKRDENSDLSWFNPPRIEKTWDFWWM